MIILWIITIIFVPLAYWRLFRLIPFLNGSKVDLFLTAKNQIIILGALFLSLIFFDEIIGFQLAKTNLDSGNVGSGSSGGSKGLEVTNIIAMVIFLVSNCTFHFIEKMRGNRIYYNEKIKMDNAGTGFIDSVKPESTEDVGPVIGQEMWWKSEAFMRYHAFFIIVFYVLLMFMIPLSPIGLVLNHSELVDKYEGIKYGDWITIKTSIMNLFM